MCVRPRFIGVDECLSLIRRGNAQSVLETLNAIKSRAGTPGARGNGTGRSAPLGVDYCRAMCFLSAPECGGGAQHGPFNARQAVLEELRWHPTHVPSRELLYELNAVIRPRLLPPADVHREEPLFSLLVDALVDHTMLTWPRLLNLFHSVRDVCLASADTGRGGGHVVECGCAGGGAAVMLAVALREFDTRPSLAHRCVFALDTFAGMPAPSAFDGMAGGVGTVGPKQSWSTGTCSAPAAGVVEMAKRFGVENRLCTIEGVFQRSIPEALLADARIQASGIDVLHVDADWYESVKCALDHLLPVMRASSQRDGRGPPMRRVVQVDDYHYWEGARLAVDEALQNWEPLPQEGQAMMAKVTCSLPTLQEIDGNAVYFHL